MTAVVVIALGTACLAGIAVFVLALARMGAKPTPQLPMTTVVTPCQLEGAISGSQVAWPS